MSAINIGEVIVANSVGVLILVILLTFRIQDKITKHLDDYLFDIMIGLAVVALIIETITFILDAHKGEWIRVLLYLTNGYLFFASSSIGFLWTLYVDYRIYHSIKRLQKILIPTGIPCLFVAILTMFDLLGAGNIFYITEQNVYIRGSFMAVPYIVLFFYYCYSVVLSTAAVKRRGCYQFFSVVYFALPCIVGTIVQGMFYGLSVGWLGVSLAFFFVQMQLQNMNASVDHLSGLYNRRYYNYFVNKVVSSRKKRVISGVMIDVNHFKSINDQFGHTTGDDAIQSLGTILSEVTTEKNTVFRLSGDEFVILSVDLQEDETTKLIDDLHRQIEAFNQSSGKPYKLSLAVGYSICETSKLNSDDFLHQMDSKMYAAKAAYYSQNDNNRRFTTLSCE